MNEAKGKEIAPKIGEKPHHILGACVARCWVFFASVSSRGAPQLTFINILANVFKTSRQEEHI